MIIKDSFIKIFEDIIKNKYNDNYSSRKFKEIIYFQEIMKVLNAHMYWSRYEGIVHWKVLHNKHREYINKGYYDELVKRIYSQYISQCGYYIFKYQSTDTSFIPNKFCSNLSRNKFYKSKKGLKISSINDANGIPLSLFIDKGSIQDPKFINKTFDMILIDPNTNKYKNSNRHKQYLLADKGYDSKKVRKIAADKGYSVIIPYNKRNTKDKTKIKILTPKQEKIYNKRIIVENYYAWIKMTPKLMFVIEKSINMYLQLLKLTTCILIFNRFLS